MQILSQALLNSTEHVRAHIENLETIPRDIRKQKRGGLSKDPATLSDFVLEEEWTTTGGENPEPFLIHDSGPDVRKRVTVFASQPALQLLSQVDTWYMDGTFSMTPNIFTHVYVIRAPLGGTAVSCVYALCQASIKHHMKDCASCHQEVRRIWLQPSSSHCNNGL